MLASSRVAFVIRDRDEPHAIASAGACVPAAVELTAASEVIDTGVTVPLTNRGAAVEAALPIRYGTHVVGALWCRWSLGVPLIAQDVISVLGLAATAAAPAVHEVCERHRAPQVAAAALLPDLVGESASLENVRQAILRAAASPFPVLDRRRERVGQRAGGARDSRAPASAAARRFCALELRGASPTISSRRSCSATRAARSPAPWPSGWACSRRRRAARCFSTKWRSSARACRPSCCATLQEGEVRRLGESITRKVDARIVAATNRPLEPEVRAGRFRQRPAVSPRRGADYAAAAARAARGSAAAGAAHLGAAGAAHRQPRRAVAVGCWPALGAYDWPGNVRELQNVLASIMVAGAAAGRHRTAGPAVAHHARRPR